jgi:hypothetical protein
MDLKIINLIFKCGRILSITPSSTRQRNLNNFEKLYGYLIFATLTSFTWCNIFLTGVSNSYLTYSQYILALAVAFTYAIHNSYIFVSMKLQKHSAWFRLLQEHAKFVSLAICDVPLDRIICNRGQQLSVFHLLRHSSNAVQFSDMH